MGAHASFTVGMHGAEGGMELEKGGPAESAVYIGYRTQSGKMHSLPFFKGVANEAERYSQSDKHAELSEVVFGESEIKRKYEWANDTFEAPGVRLKVTTPFFSIPDPLTASTAELKFASCPATFLELTIHNDSGEVWEGFFGHHSATPWMPLSSKTKLKGAVTRERMGFACDDPEAEEFIDFGIEQALVRKHSTPNFLLAPIAGLSFKVDPGQTKTIHITLGYFIDAVATFNIEARYWYTKYFSNIFEVFDYAISERAAYLQVAEKRDAELCASGLSDAQQFLVAHSTRSYYGSSEWLVDANDKPLWLVNEGEYLMINTLDLTVDMIFFELKYNPWTVRNVLEQFVNRYAYEDKVFAPNAPEILFEGGISFAHDMGVGNHFSPPGYSCYECSGIDRKCFSYMTCEQLTNWILCAGLYLSHTNDESFLNRHADLLERCFQSLLNRDHPDPAQRDGLMGYDSSRTNGGGEITTYDSLDHSLGQARRNVYLAGKCWASYLTLEKIFKQLGHESQAAEAHFAAVRCAQTLENSFDESLGFIPAVLEDGNASAIIPAVEALIYPWKMGLQHFLAEDGEFGGYIRMLKKHTEYVLKPGVCLYEDGGWKLSSSADNSWMSKICLNQFVIREILKIEYDGEAKADAAHVEWEVNGSKFYACSDQFASGKPIGSLYYPRIVTSLLWMDESAMDAFPEPDSLRTRAVESV
jgi:hypothetical protein